MYICVYVCMCVCMFVHYVCMYVSSTLKFKKLSCRHATEFYRYPTVTCDKWSVVLFFINFTILIVFINVFNFLYTQCLIKCLFA
jgi:hypothetical protein